MILIIVSTLISTIERRGEERKVSDDYHNSKYTNKYYSLHDNKTHYVSNYNDRSNRNNNSSNDNGYNNDRNDNDKKKLREWKEKEVNEKLVRNKKG